MAPPTLATLPAELRKLIVSFLAPSGADRERYARDGKIHLKRANMTARCLHDWVPEVMFQDMTLLHVSVDSASHLERFAITAENAAYLKYVKTIQVKVPPAIRWDLNTEDFDSIEDMTQQRLIKGKFKLKSSFELSDSQRQYCVRYYRAMVQPFTQNRRWKSLVSSAEESWRDVFAYFPNLERISVGCCHRWEHPAPSYTNAFVTQFGTLVISETDPHFVEDTIVDVIGYSGNDEGALLGLINPFGSSPELPLTMATHLLQNQAWASSVVLDCAPATVKSLRLSMANLDNLNQYATVNRLLSNGYWKTRNLLEGPLRTIKSLTLDMGGWKGTHGTRTWHGDTGSAGMVKYWRKLFMSMHSLTHLDIRFDSSNEGERWSNGGESDRKGCILDWLLSFPALVFEHITRLSFCGFLIDQDSLCTPKIFASQDCWPSLKHLVLDELRLMWNQEPESEDICQGHVDHLQGVAWLRACQHITQTLPGVEIEIYRPMSNINDHNDFKLHHKYKERISQLPNVKIDLQGPYKYLPLPPIADIHIHIPPPATRESTTSASEDTIDVAMTDL